MVDQKSCRVQKSGHVVRGSLVLQLMLAALGLEGVSAGFIDMDTPLDKRTTTSFVDKSTYHLVMSDEFNTPNRTFKDGHDPMWTALDKPDDDSSSVGGGSQQFYNSSFVTTTEDGMLKISTKIGKTKWNRFDHVKKEWKKESAVFNSGMVQSWEKFCFTGGIVEVDVILPGDPSIGGLWPAVWILGNLGRATYEASTNNIWPWSYDTCDRKKQDAQTISACNAKNHFGMHAFQGRGATEIDILEVMTGDSNGPLAATDPPIELPYCDMTLQVAPGITKNRPEGGKAPVYKSTRHTQANNWYEGLELHGNTSINPFFYGTYLAETKPGEPVTRTKNQAFQADAVGAAHQLTPGHFKRAHTFRMEWQPGAGGRIDWYSKGYKINETFSMEGDGEGTDWVHVFGITDENLQKAEGAQIPIEPSALIFNTAVSSTWGFPYDTPKWCPKCYDCDDPKCSCAFAPGFCDMLRDTDVAMYIDSVRLYQSRDPSAHVGGNHSIGCDPPEYPTRGWIKGHAYRYMRNAPFSYEDHSKPIRTVQPGGGSCEVDDDCGAYLKTVNLTEVYESSDSEEERRHLVEHATPAGRGKCVSARQFKGMFSTRDKAPHLCQCNTGFTGPHCHAEDHPDDTPSAYKNNMEDILTIAIPQVYLSPFMITILIALFAQMIIVSCLVARRKQKSLEKGKPTTPTTMRRPVFQVSMEDRLITGTSV